MNNNFEDTLSFILTEFSVFFITASFNNPKPEEIKVSPRICLKTKWYSMFLNSDCNINFKLSIPASCLLFCPWEASSWTQTGWPMRSRWVHKSGRKTAADWRSDHKLTHRKTNKTSVFKQPTVSVTEGSVFSKERVLLPVCGRSPWRRHSTLWLQTPWLCQPGKHNTKSRVRFCFFSQTINPNLWPPTTKI